MSIASAPMNLDRGNRMSIIGQFGVAALALAAWFGATAIVEIASAYDFGAFIFCLIFTGLATVTLCAIYPTGRR